MDLSLSQSKDEQQSLSQEGDLSSATRTVLRDGLQIALQMRCYSLAVINGPCKGREATIRSRIARIGTDPSSDLHLEQDDTVSRLHCLIEADGIGYRLRDQESKNGIMVDGYLVKDIYLRPGTVFQIGDNLIRFMPGEEAEEVQFSTSQAFGSLLGQSLMMREVFANLEKVSSSDATVLIEGESGTGKELAARAIHDQSKRQNKPFVVFDLSTIASNLLETELFGHVKGAFTGALFNHPGAMVAANGGSLFLDEVGDLATDLQPRLLRAIESRTVRPVGSTREVGCNCRIIGATNKALRHLVRQGMFREDLYWRLAVVVIRMPPLREKPEDIPLLINHFLRDLGKDPATLRISYQTMNMMQKYSWPGNVRELRNFVEKGHSDVGWGRHKPGFYGPCINCRFVDRWRKRRRWEQLFRGRADHSSIYAPEQRIICSRQVPADG